MVKSEFNFGIREISFKTIYQSNLKTFLKSYIVFQYVGGKL